MQKRQDLFLHINKFINEIDLTIDYFPKHKLDLLRKYISSIQSNKQAFVKFVSFTKTQLQPYQTQFSTVLSNTKYKSSYLDFLNNIILFNNILDFSIFQNESKNTKKDLVKYIIIMYDFCNENNVIDNWNTAVAVDVGDDDIENIIINSELNQKRRNAIFSPDKVIKPGLNATVRSDAPEVKQMQTQMGSAQEQQIKQAMASMGLGGNTGGIDTIMNDILGNGQIFDIAKNMAEQMKNENTDPMALMTSLMSGNIENSPFTSLINQMKSSIDSKIQNGELDINLIQTQAQDLLKGPMLGNLGLANLGNLGGLSDLTNLASQFSQSQGGDKMSDEEKLKMEEFIQNTMNSADKKTSK